MLKLLTTNRSNYKRVKLKIKPQIAIKMLVNKAHEL